MDRATVGGIALALVAVVASVLLDGGSLLALANFSSLVLILGGTIGATMTGFGLEELKQLPKAVRVAFREPQADNRAMVAQLVDLAEFARREGLLALDSRLDELGDPFLLKGMRGVVDGLDPELVRGMLETEMEFMARRQKTFASMLEAAGGYAPTMGIIGTVMGLVHVLANLSNAAILGPAIASAFTATLYGILTANILWLPLAGKMRFRSQQEMQRAEIMLEGVLSVQAGDNPRLLEEKLLSFLADEGAPPVAEEAGVREAG